MMTIRAFFRAVKVVGQSPVVAGMPQAIHRPTSPYDTLHLKVYYPALPTGDNAERDRGIVPANPQQAPFPVVIFFGGVNCSLELYQWLAIELAKRAIVVVLFNWVAAVPGAVGLTPGVDFAAWSPKVYGTIPTASALPALLEELDRLQSEGVLAGLLDLQKVVLGGHSAGGRVAIETANPRWFPQLAAAFGYGVHTAAPVILGYEPGTILPLPDALPLLLIGGDRDGVIANSSDRYGVPQGDPNALPVRTFHEAVAGKRNDSYLLIVSGANHYSIAHPPDPTTGQAFLDFPTTQPDAKIRELLAAAIGLFIDAHVRGDETAVAALQQLLDRANRLIEVSDRR